MGDVNNFQTTKSLYMKRKQKDKEKKQSNRESLEYRLKEKNSKQLLRELKSENELNEIKQKDKDRKSHKRSCAESRTRELNQQKCRYDETRKKKFFVLVNQATKSSSESDTEKAEFENCISEDDNVTQSSLVEKETNFTRKRKYENVINLNQSKYLKIHKSFAKKIKYENPYEVFIHELTDNANLQLQIKQFIAVKQEKLTWVCFSCHRLQFKKTTHSITNKLILKMKSLNLYEQPNTIDSNILCSSCYQSITHNLLPKLFHSNGFDLHDVPPILKKLNLLELQLISLRLPFITILTAKSLDKQKKLKGNIVSVVSDLQDTTKILPRNIENCGIIPVILKRKLCFSHGVVFRYCNTLNTWQALLSLSDKPLYKENCIDINQDWLKSTTEYINNQIKDFKSLNLDESDSDDERDPEPVSLMTTDTLLQKRDVVQIAPGEGRTPLSLLKDVENNGEEKSFPHLYGGFKRNIKNILKDYNNVTKTEILNKDRRFGNDTRNLFFKYRVKTLKVLRDSISIHIRKTMKQKLTAATILKDEVLKEYILKDDAYRFLKPIVSSPAYWKGQKKNIFAMIRQLGSPLMFLTLAANERHWVDLVMTLYQNKYNSPISYEDACNLNDNVKCSLIRSDPVICTLYFNNLFQGMFNNLILSKNGIFQENFVTHFYWRIEYQQRGSPHVHALLWVKDPPKFDIKKNNYTELVDFIDKHISCGDISDYNYNVYAPYMSLQKHNHTFTCFKSKKDKLNKICRFHIPFLPMKETTILTPLQTSHKRKVESIKKLEQIKLFLNENVENNLTFEDFLTRVKLDHTQYITLIRLCIKKPTIFIKRNPSQVLINPFNKIILPLWNGNMDLQVILDSYSLAQYIINYISKCHKGVSKLLRDCLSKLNNEKSNLLSTMLKLGSCFINAQEISAPEAVYSLASLKQSMCSEKCLFVNTGPKGQRTKLLKSKKELKLLDKNSTSIFVDDNIDYYKTRPIEYNHLSLAEFCSDYNVFKSRDSSQLNIIKRSTRKIIRYVKYNKKSDLYNYQRSLVMLFYPWQEREITDHEQLINIFNDKQKCNAIFKLYKDFNQYDEEKLEKETATLETLDFNDESYDPQYKEDYENLDNSFFEGSEMLQFINEINIKKNSTKTTSTTSKNNDFNVISKSSMNKYLDDDSYENLITSLNYNQRMYLYHYSHYLRQQIFHRNTEKLHNFITGPAGSGKSLLINALTNVTYRIVTVCRRNIHEDPMTKKVLLCAPTAKAASLIGGNTLHTSLRIPLTYVNDNNCLSNSTLNTLQCDLHNVRTIIVDEISMVSKKMFYNTNIRTQQIYNNEEDFGNINILFFGDFYQLPPVKSVSIYNQYAQVNNDDYSTVSTNYLWQLFNYYELSEIMRQKNELRFSELLTKFSRGSLSTKDYEDLQKMCSKSNFNENESTHLFYINQDVDEHNEYKMNQMKNIVRITSKAFDFGSEKNINDLLKKPRREAHNLDHELILQKNIRYRVTVNIDTNDKLTNGTSGIVKEWETKVYKNKTIVTAVWVLFDDPSVGIKSRSVDCHLTDDRLTKIQRITKEIYLNKNSRRKVIRSQIPLTPSEAMTIHTSQGSTLNKVTLHITKSMPNSLLYVGLSRVTSPSNINVIGEWPINPPLPDELVHTEMLRLENKKKLELKYDIINEKIEIVSHNIRSLKKHFQFILSDPIYSIANIIYFQETCVNNAIPLPNYKIIGHIPYNESNKKGGSILYCKENINMKLVDVFYENFNDNGHLELIVSETDTYTLICLYCSPKFPLKVLISKLQQYNLVQYNNEKKKYVIIGDFNKCFINMSNSLKTYISSIEGKTLIDDITTDYSTCIDNAITNIPNAVGFIYEDVISDHRPIYMQFLSNGSIKKDSRKRFNSKTQDQLFPKIDDALNENIVHKKSKIFITSNTIQNNEKKRRNSSKCSK